MPGGRRHVRLRRSQVVLDFVTMFLEYLVTELERVAHPVLDAIVQKVWLAPEQRVDTVPADHWWQCPPDPFCTNRCCGCIGHSAFTGSLWAPITAVYVLVR